MGDALPQTFFIISQTSNNMMELVEAVEKFQLEGNLIGKWNTVSTLGSTLAIFKT